MKQLILVLLIFCFQFGYADYIKVSRNANIYSEATKSSELIKKANIGELYELVSLNQVNGYFNIRISNSNNTGWIYRTLVRRYEGILPGNESVTALNKEVHVTVLDVGAGLCTVIKMPDDKYLIYDAGHYRGNGGKTFAQIQEVVPIGSTIDLMVLSHTDADHIGAAGQIIRNYSVNTVLHTGYEKSLISSDDPTATYNRLISALSERPLTQEVNLNKSDSIITPGISIHYGEAKLTFLCGFGMPMAEWGLSSQSEKLNSVSIVMRLDYKGTSVIFAGDAVGRHNGSDDSDPIATESYLLNNARTYLDIDILIAPHHGADNGSSQQFIDTTSPEVVIFAAGNHFGHPRHTTVNRYMSIVDSNNFYRTDRGDNETNKYGHLEWKKDINEGCLDSYGDDDIIIEIDDLGEYSVYYNEPNRDCTN